MKKSITHVIFALLYLGAMAVCLLFIIKPGASIFYFKTTLDSQAVIPDAGHAFRYDLDISPLIFRIADILVYEDGHQLNSTGGNIVVQEGMNAYAISKSSTGATHIYFASSDNSNPITNERSYTLYIPLNFITRSMGILYLVILLPGLIWFLYFSLAIPDHRKTLFHSPTGTFIVLDRFFEYFPKIIKPDVQLARQQIKTRAAYWRQLFTITILVSYIYIFMEWVFFITMPSFMSLLSLPEKLEVFLISSLGLSLISLAGIVIVMIIDIYALSIRRDHVTSYVGVLDPHNTDLCISFHIDRQFHLYGI